MAKFNLPSLRRAARLMLLAGVATFALANAGRVDAQGLPPGDTNPLWHEQKIKNFLPDMTWPEVELMAKTDMVIIPVASLEEHGPQGPIGTDYLNAVEKAKLIAQQTDVLVAPIMLPGNSPYHMGFPGTIAISEETVEKVYFEAIQSLIKTGFKRFIIMNGHGGNAATSGFIADRVNQETSGIAVVLDVGLQPYLKHKPSAAQTVFDRHAGVGETSSSMYLIPNLVEIDQARKAHITYPDYLRAMVPKVIAGDPTANLVFLAETLKAKETGKHTSTREMTDTGSWTELDPKISTAARGKADTEDYIQASVKFIDAWKDLRPMNAK